MKQVFLLLVFLCFSVLAICQATYSVKGEMYGGVNKYLFSRLDTINCEVDNSSSITSTNKYFYIIGDTGCKKDLAKWYVIGYDNKIVFAQKYFFREIGRINMELEFVRQKTPDRNERLGFSFNEIARLQSEEKLRIEQEEKNAEIAYKEQLARNKHTLDSLNKLIDKTLVTFRSKNLILYDWSWNYPEYSSSIDVSITILNPYKQKIKYLWFTIKAYNPVDDIVRDGITSKAEVTVKGVGPIEYSEKGSYEFENVLYSKVVDRVKISQIKLQFFDGTFKVISNPVVMVKDDE